MRHLGLGLVMLGMAVMAQAAAPENNAFINDHGLPSMQIAQFNVDDPVRPRSYRLSLSIVPVHAADAVSFGSGVNNEYRVPPVAERGKEIVWAGNSSRTQFFGSDYSTSVPLLRLETKGERLEVRPRRNSISVQWIKSLH